MMEAERVALMKNARVFVGSDILAEERSAMLDQGAAALQVYPTIRRDHDAHERRLDRRRAGSHDGEARGRRGGYSPP